ncbi:MAG: guanylate kinase [Bacteroidales bacterium]|nr:guanylate kinase [Bacteroidales bacterium]
MNGKSVIFSAPSGSGKTTIVNHLVKIDELKLEFSVSACTRKMREGEVHGRDYYFMSAEEFRMRIDDNEFVEWEEVYKNHYYGTLKSELDRIWLKSKNVVFDVDVIGGMNLKRHFGSNSLSVFVMPPSLEELEKRLISRGLDTPDKIKGRMSKANYEMKYAGKFDKILVNNDLDRALKEAEALVREFLNK